MNKFPQPRYQTHKSLLTKNDSMADCGTTGTRTSWSSGGSAISNLGRDQLYAILLLLPAESVLAFAMTCKKFRAMASSDTLWESLCLKAWGPTSVEGFKKSLKAHQPLPWMRLYKMVSQFDSVSCEKLVSESYPDPRASHSLNFVSDCLVLFGGGREGGRHLDDTWVAYVGGKNGERTVKWQKVNSGTPSGRFGHTCVVMDDFVLLFGGIDDQGNRLNDTWAGHLARLPCSGGGGEEVALTWSLLDVGPISPPPRGAHGACRVAGRGRVEMAVHGGIGPGGVRFGDTWLLELSENSRRGAWREIRASPSPPPRSGHTLTRAGGAGCVLFGGRGARYEALDDIWLLESREGRHQWVQIPYEFQNVGEGASLPRVGHSATGILGGRVLIYGGEDSSRHRKDDFWVLDLTGVGSNWDQNLGKVSEIKLAKMWKGMKVNGYRPECRSFHRACADQSGGCVYVFGGMVDGLVGVAQPSGLKFDGELFVVDLLLQM